MTDRNTDTYDTSASRRISRAITRRIYTRILIVLLCLAALTAGCFFAVRQYRESTSWHLSDLPQLTDRQAYARFSPQRTEDQILTDNAAIYLQSCAELFMPGYSLSLSGSCEKTAYGEYTFPVMIRNEFRAVRERNRSWGSPASAVISNGTITISDTAESDLMKDSGNEWWHLSDSEYRSFYSIPEPADEITDLPDSAYVEMDVRLKDPVTAEQLLEIQAVYPDSRILYAVTYIDEDTDGISSILGFSLMRSQINALVSSEVLDEYPDLFMQAETAYDVFHTPYSYYESLQDESVRKSCAEKYENHFRSILKLLTQSHVLSSRQNTLTEKYCAQIQSGPVSILGFRASFTREDALRILDEEFADSVHIEDIKMNRFDE